MPTDTPAATKPLGIRAAAPTAADAAIRARGDKGHVIDRDNLALTPPLIAAKKRECRTSALEHPLLLRFISDENGLF